jgi:hypothetical protein
MANLDETTRSGKIMVGLMVGALASLVYVNVFPRPR